MSSCSRLIVKPVLKPTTTKAPPREAACAHRASRAGSPCDEGPVDVQVGGVEVLQGGDLPVAEVAGRQTIAVEPDLGPVRAVRGDLDAAVADGVGAGVAVAGEHGRQVDAVAGGEVTDVGVGPRVFVEHEAVVPAIAGQPVAAPADVEGVAPRRAGPVIAV